MARVHAWLALAPFATASVLGGHALAYELTRTDGERFHAYLAHAPQVLVILMLGAAALAWLSRRSTTASFWSFALVAPVAFLLQEHLERLLHDGHVPWLVTSPTLLLGLVLQVPLAVLGALVARWLLTTLADAPPARRRRVQAFSERVLPLSRGLVRSRPGAGPDARGPPALLPS